MNRKNDIEKARFVLSVLEEAQVMLLAAYIYLMLFVVIAFGSYALYQSIFN